MAPSHSSPASGRPARRTGLIRLAGLFVLFPVVHAAPDQELPPPTPEKPAPAEKPTVARPTWRLPVSSAVITVDGRLDEPAWAEATQAVALGDVDGDGDLVVGNQGQGNQLYLNLRAYLTGGSALWTGAGLPDITADARLTTWVALGDVYRDGNLDLVTETHQNQPNRLYLNNGTAAPRNGVAGSDITADAHTTWADALEDVDGDGDLDLAAGNGGVFPYQPNRLYLNNGTGNPWNGVT